MYRDAPSVVLCIGKGHGKPKYVTVLINPSYEIISNSLSVRRNVQILHIFMTIKQIGGSLKIFKQDHTCMEVGAL